MKGVPGAFGGMDTHVKEGQLYVQHQKFGKVSPRNVAVIFFFFFARAVVALTENLLSADL